MEHCEVFGLDIAVSDMPEAISYVCEHLEEFRGGYITFVNAHTNVTAYEDKAYCKVQRDAKINFADGQSIVFYEKRHGFSKAKRVAGPDFMEEILKISAEKGYRHFFYGSSPKVLKKLEEKLKQKYPNVEIKMYSPPYESNLSRDYGKDLQMINDFHPDFIWVGLGAPKQERWMNLQNGKVNGVMLGVGVGFAFHAGTIKRAPKWMQNVGLEWFWRMLTDPKRLVKRYFVTNTKFISMYLKEKNHGKN